MIALSLRQTGFRRMGAGVSMLRQAFLDAGRGLYAILSGFCLFIAGAALTPWIWISLPFARRTPVKARDRRSWKSFASACRRLGEAALDWTVSLLVWGLLIVGLVLLFHNTDAPFREAITNPANIIYPIAFFLGLAALCLVGWLALRFGASLLAHVSRRLTREGLQAIAVLAVVMLVGAIGAYLYASLKPTHLIALIAGVAVLAGLAGFALISFGPSGIAIFNLGRRGHAPLGPSELRLQPHAAIGRFGESARVADQPVISGPAQGAAPLLLAADGIAQHTGSARPTGRERKGIGKPAWMSPISVDPTGVMLLAAVVVALLLAWGGGELLLRTAPGTTEPVAEPPDPAVSPSTAHDATPPGTGSTAVIQLGADGEAADVSWRSGYRQLTARFDDGRAVQRLSLPATACSAAAIVAFGAASSDGSPARNGILAERRARWLADWTRTELSGCPGPVPAVISVSLGQAQPGLPLPAQRAVRLLAIREEDMRNPAFGSDPAMLRDMARVSFEGMEAFTRFDACILAGHKDDQLLSGWLRSCDGFGHPGLPSRPPTAPR